jgi:hypothetical protein
MDESERVRDQTNKGNKYFWSGKWLKTEIGSIRFYKSRICQLPGKIGKNLKTWCYQYTI